MADPFAIATNSIFSSQIAVSGELTDSDNNQIDARCVVRTSIYQAFPGWDVTLPENKTTIMVMKVGQTFDSDDIESVSIAGTQYSVDGIMLEDDYTVTFSVKEVIPEPEPEPEPDPDPDPDPDPEPEPGA